MKTLFKSITVGLIISVLFALVPFEGQCKDISEKVFRVHILANSDSDEDQALKLKVRDAVVTEGEHLLSCVHSKEEAMNTVAENLPLFAET
ncbi:MAG: stage II sporulation protein R, partial [Ruminococcus sp.]